MSTCPYRRILLVVDLTEDSRRSAARLRDRRQLSAPSWTAARGGIRAGRAHGRDPHAGGPLEDELLVRARQRLTALAAELGLPGALHRVESGNVKAEVVRVARERQVDLIVIGSRERHGLSILVNFTEDTRSACARPATCSDRAGAAKRSASPGKIGHDDARSRTQDPRRGQTATSRAVEPSEHRYVFSYTITIRNEGQRPPSC